MFLPSVRRVRRVPGQKGTTGTRSVTSKQQVKKRKGGNPHPKLPQKAASTVEDHFDDCGDDDSPLKFLDQESSFQFNQVTFDDEDEISTAIGSDEGDVTSDEELESDCSTFHGFTEAFHAFSNKPSFKFRHHICELFGGEGNV